jgi:hypothetical protein
MEIMADGGDSVSLWETNFEGFTIYEPISVGDSIQPRMDTDKPGKRSANDDLPIFWRTFLFAPLGGWLTIPA